MTQSQSYNDSFSALSHFRSDHIAQWSERTYPWTAPPPFWQGVMEDIPQCKSPSHHKYEQPWSPPLPSHLSPQLLDWTAQDHPVKGFPHSNHVITWSPVRGLSYPNNLSIFNHHYRAQLLLQHHIRNCCTCLILWEVTFFGGYEKMYKMGYTFMGYMVLELSTEDIWKLSYIWRIYKKHWRIFNGKILFILTWPLRMSTPG